MEPNSSWYSRGGGVSVLCAAMVTALVGDVPLSQDGLSHTPSEKGALLGGRYELGACIGRGGMGLVFEARHVLLGRKVAVKLLRSGFVQSPAWVERFRREARAASAIGHENIVEVLDIGVTEDGAPYYVMEFLDGETLAALIRREAPLTWRRVRGIALQLCDALAAAHRAGVVHRDLKPANCVRIARAREPDFVKILDFGIAKLLAPGEGGARLTNTGEVFGTPGYMAPEQICGGRVDARADLYALAVIVYQLCAGRLPFTGETPEAMVHQQFVASPSPIRQLVPGCDVPEVAEQALRAALRPDPGLRPASVEAFAALLGPPTPRSVRSLEERTTEPRFVRPLPPLRTTRGPSVALGWMTAMSLAAWFGAMMHTDQGADGRCTATERVGAVARPEVADVAARAPSEWQCVATTPVGTEETPPRMEGPFPLAAEAPMDPPVVSEGPARRPSRTRSAAKSLALVVDAQWPDIERCLCERLDGIPPTTLGMQVRVDAERGLSAVALGTSRGSVEVQGCLERGFAGLRGKVAIAGERSVEVSKQPSCAVRRRR